MVLKIILLIIICPVFAIGSSDESGANRSRVNFKELDEKLNSLAAVTAESLLLVQKRFEKLDDAFKITEELNFEAKNFEYSVQQLKLKPWHDRYQELKKNCENPRRSATEHVQDEKELADFEQRFLEHKLKLTEDKFKIDL